MKLNARTKTFISAAIFFSVSLFLINVIIVPLLDGTPITQQNILRGVLLYGLEGLVFGYFMHNINKPENDVPD